MKDEELLAYVASVVDDTASVGVNRYFVKRDQRIVYTSFIHIYMANGETIEFINKNFERGTVYETLNSYNKKKLQNLRYGGKRCGEILRRLMPYLKIKREEAEWAIRLSEMLQDNSKMLSVYELQERENCYQGWREAASKRRSLEEIKKACSNGAR